MCRFALLVFAPHTDPSEARYAEIARKMVETGDWITPQYDYGVPFWAKPPLAMWMSALGMEVFGVNEFGSRIFVFLGAMMVLALVWDAARREFGKEAGWAAAAILAGMPLFFFCSAAVMTDLALLLGTTLAMVGFRGAIRGDSRWHGYGVFTGVAIGLLAKGPVALALSAPPIMGWLFLTGRWRGVWKALPWFSGTLLMLAIVLPWYLAAEMKTPGFLSYFLIGEHWDRFLVRGWDGDLYGAAHTVMPGTIWVYLLLGSMPWCLGLLKAFPGNVKSLREWAMFHHGHGLYWVLWVLWPAILFTLARNIIVTNPLPSLPALAMLLAELHSTDGRSDYARDEEDHVLSPAMVCGTLLLVAGAFTVAIVFPQYSPKHSEKMLVRRYEKERSPGDNLVYYGPRKFSAEFYSSGCVDSTTSAAVLESRLNAPGRTFLAMPSYWYPLVPAPIRRHLQLVATWNRGPSLYVERTDLPDMSGIDPARTPPIGN